MNCQQINELPSQVTDCDLSPSEVAVKPYENLAAKSFPAFFPVKKCPSLEKQEMGDQRQSSLSDFIVCFNTMMSEESKIAETNPPAMLDILGQNEVQKYDEECLKNEGNSLKKGKASVKNEKFLSSDDKAKEILVKPKLENQSGFFKFAISFLFVNRFIENLKSLVVRREEPTESVVGVLNDKAYEQSKKPGSFVCKSTFCDLFFVVSPDNKLILIYDVIAALITSVYLIMTPLAFSSNLHIFSANFKKPAVLAYFVEIVLGFSLADFGLNGELVRKREEICQIYFKEWFLRDLLCFIFVLIDCFHFDTYFVLRIILWIPFSFISFKKLQIRKKKLFLWLGLSRQTIRSIEFCFLFLIFLLIVHIYSCVWLFIQDNESDVGGIEGVDLGKKYLGIFCIVIGIVTTTGFPSDKPFPEKIIAILTFLSFFFLVGYNIDFILASLLQTPHASDWTDTQVAQEAIPFISKLRLIKVRENLDEFTSTQENDITSEMQKKLMREIAFQGKLKIIKETPFLRANFSGAFLVQLALKMRKMCFFPGEMIIENERVAFCPDLFLIDSGMVELSVNSNKPFQSLSKNSLFGLNSFISEKKLEYSIRAASFSSVLAISKQEFLSLVRLNPLDYERYCFLRDSVSLYQRNFEFPCRVCSMMSHTLLSCPKCHLLGIKIPERDNIRLQQNRKSTTRRLKRSLNAKGTKKRLKNAIEILYSECSSIMDAMSSFEGTAKKKVPEKKDQIIKRNNSLTDSEIYLVKEGVSSSFFFETLHLPTPNRDFSETSETSLEQKLKPRRIQKLKSFSSIDLGPGIHKSLINNEMSCRNISMIEPFGEAKGGKSLMTSSKINRLTQITEDVEEKETAKKTSTSSGKATEIMSKKWGGTEWASAIVFEESMLFEKAKSFNIYFKHNNVEEVMRNVFQDFRKKWEIGTEKIIFPEGSLSDGRADQKRVRINLKFRNQSQFIGKRRRK